MPDIAGTNESGIESFLSFFLLPLLPLPSFPSPRMTRIREEWTGQPPLWGWKRVGKGGKHCDRPVTPLRCWVINKAGGGGWKGDWKFFTGSLLIDKG